MPKVGNHNYSYAEINYGGTNRGIKVTINDIGAKNNTNNYRLGRAYNPHNLDANWYLNHINQFYSNLGDAIANYLENHQANWNQNINWPNAIHARIHGNGYHAIREDLY